MGQQNEMVVVHVSTAKSWRGGEQQLAYLFEELDALGIQQHIVCLKGGALASKCKELQWEHTEAPKAFNYDIRFAKAIKMVVGQCGASLLHTHDAHAHSMALLAYRFFGNPTPIIVSRRVDFPVRSKAKYNHTQVAKIVCVSKAIERITGAAITDKTKLTTVHSGIELSRFEGRQSTGKMREEFNLAADTWLIGNVAALAPHKDYFTFLDAAKLVIIELPNVRFFAIGSGPLEEEIKAYCKKLELDDFVIFTGFRSDIPEVLPELDTFLISSETEGLGTSILDAFACKVPVVACAAGGIPEIVLHEKTGLIAPVEEAEELAKQVIRMHHETALREKLVAGATEHLKQFTKATTAAKTLQVYQSILASK